MKQNFEKLSWKIILVVIAALILIFVFKDRDSCPSKTKMAIVKGNSMAGVFENRDTVKVDYAYYPCHPIERGDIVVLNVGGKDSEILKKVYGVAGDTFGLEKQTDGKYAVRVNGQIIRNSTGIPFAFVEDNTRMLRLYVQDYKGVIPTSTMLVFGNQPSGSLDSSAFGLIGSGFLRGKVLTEPR